MLINDYDMMPPLDQSINFKLNQLNPLQTTDNYLNIAKNSYELNDVYSGIEEIKISGGVQEGEYYKLGNIQDYTFTYETTQKTVLLNAVELMGTEVHHKRDVYNFLFVLADFGGF